MTVPGYTLGDDALFALEAPPPVTLADKFLFPPFSVLDRRTGEWTDRKRRWLALGIRSELGRDVVTWNATQGSAGWQAAMRDKQPGHVDGYGSIFDPVVCELVYRWFTPPRGRVLDPFAGGSVRGIVASVLGRQYLGVDLSTDQVAANETQAHLGSDIAPRWVVGDSRNLAAILGAADKAFDLVFTCPPYADLERYSDNPRDLSTMAYDDFLDAYDAIIRAALAVLHRNRFVAWVVSDVRDRTGCYRGLVGDTVRAFELAGARLYNDAILLDKVASASIRAGIPFTRSRKLARVHQHLLVFVKGDPRRATAAINGTDTEGITP